MSAKLFEKFGPAASPGALLALSPLELMALFTRPRDGGEEFSGLTELRRINHEVRAPKGLPPVAPDWLCPEVPRHGC